MILIFSLKISNRLRYSARLIFKELLGVPVELTSEAEEFNDFTGPKLVYGSGMEATIVVPADGLLFERGVSSRTVEVGEYDGKPILFPSRNKGVFPFDIFSAAFYMASRYEEYLPYVKDGYGRFKAEDSLAYQNGFHEIPVVNHWARMIQEEVSKNHPEFVFAKKQFSYISTIDVDNAFAYLEKGVVRTIGATMRDLIEFKFNSFSRRIKVLLGKEKDPFDTFIKMHNVHKAYNVDARYFFLLADYGTNDKNVSPNSRKLQSLIKSVADYHPVGIHPSFGSNFDDKKLSVEIARLRNIINRDVDISRQHFLMVHLPQTYRNLIDEDIKEDYSMGFPSVPGFRAGLACPFYFYDLDLELETSLRVFPFAFMESTYKYYMNLSPHHSLESMHKLISAVKEVNGTLVTLWHNDSLSEFDIWEGWGNVYEEMIKLVRSKA